jgi:hypothetical protein
MNANRTMTILGSSVLFSLITSTAAFAAPSTHTVYSSGLLVLLFLGFCALVVVAQLIPAMITLYGMIKGAVAARKMAEAESRTN